MTDLKRAGQKLQGHVQDAAHTATHHAAPGLEALARFGYASKGVVYGMLGFLALSVALGRPGGATTDTKGTLLRLQDLPLGTALMWILTLGLIGYATWQLLRAALDPEHQGTGGKGLLKRSGYALSGAANITLAVFAAQLATRGAAARNQDSEAQAASTVMTLPGGQLLLGLAGLALLGLAASQLYTAYGAKFMKRMAFTDFGARHQTTLQRLGQIGIASRATLMTIIGVFLLIAAWRHSAGSVVGISEALTWLHGQPAGNVLLGLVAVGTLCYGAWCVVQAVYRRIRVEG